MNREPRLHSFETKLAVMSNELKSLKNDDMTNMKEWVQSANRIHQRTEDSINYKLDRLEQKIDQLGNNYFHRYTTIASLIVAFISIVTSTIVALLK